MIRTFIIIMCFITTVSANDIYVGQVTTPDATPTNPESTGGFTEPKTDGSTYQQPTGGTNFEKRLFSVDTTQYCSVVAGCLEGAE